MSENNAFQGTSSWNLGIGYEKKLRQIENLWERTDPYKVSEVSMILDFSKQH